MRPTPTDATKRTARLGPSTPDDSRTTDLLRPATQTLEAVAPHLRHCRSAVHRSSDHLYLQRASHAASAGIAVAVTQAQLRCASGPAVRPDTRGESQGEVVAA